MTFNEINIEVVYLRYFLNLFSDMKIAFLIFLFFVIESKTSILAQVRIEINPKTNCNNEIRLSDLISDVEYIPLETNVQSLISDIAIIRITDSLLFIKNRTPPSLRAFDYNGNFIAKIGTEGKGPTEINAFRTFCIDEKNRNVLILNRYPQKIIIFSYDGTFINSQLYDENTYMRDIDFFSDDKFVSMQANGSGRTSFSYRLYTSKHQFIDKKIKPLSFSMKGSFGLPEAFSYYTYNNTFKIKENLLNDTLYSISESLEFVPSYVFDFGKLTFPVEMQIKSLELIMNGRSNEFNKYIMPAGILETYNYLILRYRLYEKFYWSFYNKKSKEICSYENEGIINDYDGGPAFCPIYQKNNVCVGFVYAYEFIEYVNSNTFKTSTPLYPEKKTALEKLANSLNENDNPVLMLVKLKE
jgi:hypothetical protein